MVTKLFLRPTTSFPVTTIFFLPKPSLHKLTTITSIHSTTHQSTLTSESSFLYGPSLHKGKNPLENLSQKHQQKQIQDWEFHSPSGSRMIKEESPDGASEFDQEFFARVFDIAALRVPARECFDLERRIRGHLLNWPRIRNIARVPGDEVEEKIGALLGDDKRNGSEEEDEEGKKIDVLNRRIYGRAEGDGEKLSPVLYRERLAKEFNARGFVRFRNLAKISRPKRKKKKGKEGRGEESKRQGNYRKGKDKFAMVEVVEEEEEGEDWKGLLGEEFKGRRNWRGSTRLLLLDERYAQKSVEELPQAIKVANPNSLDALHPVLQVALQEAMGKSSPFTFELVRCKLTLYYDYWQMNEILETLLPKDMIIPSSFETVGHIAHLNLRDEHLPYKKLIAKVVLDKNKPKIQTVVNKIDAIHNDYRTMQLEVLAGNHSLVTTVIESGLRFHVDLATVYWNSKLATERQRLVNGFTCRDVVCDVFSGVGPVAISAARVVKRVYANDLNPYAVDFLERNSVLNKLEKKIEVFNMDGRRFINAMFSSEKAQSITQVVMNLPNDAAEYLDAFRGIFRDKPKDREFSMPMIHIYGFSKASDPEFDFHERIRIALEEVAVDVEMRRVRLVAPGKWMLCASFRLPVSVAYADAYTEDAK